VPRLWTSPTRAPTRTERHVGPPVTRLPARARLIEVVGMTIVLQWLPLTVLLIDLVIKIIAPLSESTAITVL
jgi:hypothetical protein